MQLKIPKINKYSILFSLIVLVIFLEVIIIAPRVLEKSNDEYAELEKSMETAAVADKSQAIEQKARGVHLLENGVDGKGYELFAVEAVGTADLKWVLKEVKIQFFNDNISSFFVTGDVGEIDGTSKDMIIRGHVTTNSTNGYSFKTDNLKYISAQKTMTSEDPVEMEGPHDKSGKGFRLTGEKLLVDIVKNKMSILEKIIATKTINNKDFHLTSVRADFSNKNQEAEFSGDVKMKFGEMSVQSAVANFYYSDMTKALVKILLKQGVEFTEGERKGSSSALEIDLVEDKMIMRGQPKIQMGEDEIKGYEIVFIEGGKKMKISRSSKKTLK